MKGKISDKTAIVTGAGNGIGKAIAEKLTEFTRQVLAVDIEESSKDNPNFIKCDITKGNEIDRLFQKASDKIGIPDILILNAGQGIQEKLTEGDPEKWQKIIDLNLMGTLRCIRAFVPGMLREKKGNVIFISSVAANQPHPYGGIYSASKSALETIAETLRLETLPHINITVISPGIVDTQFFKHQVSGNNTVNGMGMGAISPEEIADDVLYVINKKNGTSINKIVTRPVKQTF